MANTIDLTKVLIIEHIISLQHATKIVKALKAKKHAKMGYYFELTDLGMKIWDKRIDAKYKRLIRPGNYCVPRFGDYPNYPGASETEGYHLKVWRDRS